MYRTRFDVGVKVPEDDYEIVSETVNKIIAERKLNEDYVKIVPQHNGYVVTLIQSQGIPFYILNDATLELAKRFRKALKIGSAVINKSTCIIDEKHEAESLAKNMGYQFVDLISKADEDKLFNRREDDDMDEKPEKDYLDTLKDPFYD